MGPSDRKLNGLILSVTVILSLSSETHSRGRGDPAYPAIIIVCRVICNHVTVIL
jgi:hypothetical protein